MKLILLGAPGAGKGTQAEILCDRLNIPTISTGNILRAAVKNGTPTGLKAKSFMDSGQLVPDEVIIGIISERLQEDDCKNGYILDGVPRTIAQAEAIEKAGITFDAVVSIEISDETIMNRMSGRRVCESCGASYHVVAVLPKQEGVCDRPRNRQVPSGRVPPRDGAAEGVLREARTFENRGKSEHRGGDDGGDSESLGGVTHGPQSFPVARLQRLRAARTNHYQVSPRNRAYAPRRENHGGSPRPCRKPCASRRHHPVH